MHCPDVSAINALEQDWSCDNNYANPPWDLLEQVAQKINSATRLRLTLVAPHWPGHLGYQQLLRRVSTVTLLPQRKRLFTRDHRAFGKDSPPRWDVAVMRYSF